MAIAGAALLLCAGDAAGALPGALDLRAGAGPGGRGGGGAVAPGLAAQVLGPVQDDLVSTREHNCGRAEVRVLDGREVTPAQADFPGATLIARLRRRVRREGKKRP